MQALINSGVSMASLGGARSPMRVAVVTETYPPEVNGVALTLQRMLEGLRTRRHVVQLVRLRQHADDLPQRARGFHEVLMRGLPIPRYPHLRMGLPCAQKLERLWALQRPDVVHIATEGPLGWSALRAAQRLGAAGGVGLPHQLPRLQPALRPRLAATRHRRLPARVSQPHVDARWCRRPALQRELAAQGFENLRVVARGVDTHALEPEQAQPGAAPRCGVPATTRWSCCACRGWPPKRTSRCCGARSTPSCGAASMHGWCWSATARSGRSCEALCRGAHFAGVRRGEDLAAHYASADLFVFPSLTETFGNVVPEAMASGLPVVAFDHAAAGQLIRHGDSGWLAAPHEAVQFVDMAAHAASDLARLRVMGARARESALALDWQRVIDDLESVLRRAVAPLESTHGPLWLRPLST